MTESLIDKFRTFPDNDGCNTITCKEKYKQQILENAEIVKRLDKIISDYENMITLGKQSEFIRSHVLEIIKLIRGNKK